MNKTGNAADRVRHILQAMERSIDSARQRRTQTHGSYPRPVPAPTPVAATIRNGSGIIPDPQPANRVKARPKRLP